MTFKRFTFLLILAQFWAFCFAQFSEPATFSIKQKRLSPTKIIVTFHASIEAGWHIYSTDIASGGPTPATFNIDNSKGIKPAGKLRAIGKAKRMMDDIFGMEVSYFENSCTFEQDFTITEKEYSLNGYLEYGACDDKNCTPPTAVDVKINGSDGPEAPLSQEYKKTEELTGKDSSSFDSTITTSILTKAPNVNNLWSDATSDLKSIANADQKSGHQNGSTLWWLFFMGVLGGLIALLTPCVWPIIPMTVSFFLKRAEKKSRGVKDAVIYGLSIIAIYVLLGFVVTLIFGANALNTMSTNAFINVFFCLLLIVFGISFLGFFELTLPSTWSNKTDEKARNTTGLLSIFIMAFTLVLVSFSCTGPIIGFMLVEIANIGNILGPCIGMLGFAFALAIPFTFFALFPTLLKKAPKSGSWMNTIKVILGFVEIAFAMKFFSVADLAYGWGILSRETFLIIWTLLSLILALYLFGIIRLPIDRHCKSKRSVTKICLGLISFAFAIYLIPGILGKPLPAVSAFTPPMYTQHIKIIKDDAVEAQFRDYDKGMAYAQKHNKPVLIDFTGYGCVNCREMEQKVWNDPQVAELIRNNFVLISLYVDDRTPLPRHIQIQEKGKTVTLRTVGDKWSYLQRVRFGANAQPFYVVCSPQGHPIRPPYGFDTNPKKFVDFLKGAL